MTADTPTARPQDTPRFAIHNVEFVKSATLRSHFPKEDLPQVAFVGRSNVGKSSLLNIVTNRKRMAHVSSTPGRTQLVNFFLVNQCAYFVDLPGYGFAKAPLSVKTTWEKMITGYLTKNENLRLVIALFDARRQRTAEDHTLLDWLTHFRIPFAAVLTKMDKLTYSEKLQAEKAFREEFETRAPVAVIPFSSQTRLGREEVLEVIGRMIQK